MFENYGTEDVVQRLLSELQCLHQFYRDTPNLKTLKELASELSSYLPQVSDLTLIAIDDLICGENSVAGTRLVSETLIKFLVENCYQIFHDAIFEYIVKDHEVEEVFLQLLELLPDDILLKPQFENVVKAMMRYDHGRDMESQLKRLKIAVEKQRDAIKFHVVDSVSKLGRHSDLCHVATSLWILRLTDQSYYEHPNKKRWASWVSEMSTIILEKLPFGKDDLKFPLIKYIETCKHQKEDLYNQEFASIVFHTLESRIIDRDESSLFMDHLYKHFMSAKDKTLRIGRLQSFVKGLHDSRWEAPEILHQGFLNYSREEIQGIVAYFKDYSHSIILEIRNLFHVLQGYPSIKLMKLVSRCSYDIGLWTYVSKDITSCSSYLTFKEETVGLMNKYFTQYCPSNSDDFETSEESFEKNLVHCFHKFMKRLQVLDIFYTIWLMLEDDIVAVGSYPPGFIDTIFRSQSFGKSCEIKKSIKKYLVNPGERSRIHFALQIVLRKCPFLILPHRGGICHMENLIKILSGRNISNVSTEELYFALKF